MQDLNQFILPTIPEHQVLSSKVQASLNKRLEKNPHYASREIEEIALLNRSLFPADRDLTLEITESFRAMCSLSQCKLKEAYEIKSHRPFLGKVIVAVKRSVWKLIKGQMDDTFYALQDCFSWMIYSQAQATAALLKPRESAE